MERSLLIVHQGALGDFVVTFPAILLLQKYFQPIDALCESRHGQLAQQLKLIRQGFALETAFFASLYSEDIDPRVQPILIRYSQILLFSFSERLEQAFRRATRARVDRIPPRPAVSEPIHVSEHLRQGLIRRGLVPATELEPNLQALVQEGRCPTPSRPDPVNVLVHPGAGSQKKMWPLPNFLRVAAQLESEGLNPEYLLGPAEHRLGRHLFSAGGRSNPVHILSDLRDLLNLLQSVGAFIGNDSGVSHLAAFLGLPTVVIFGPSDPVRWKPIGRAVEVVRAEVGCDPCFESKPDDCDFAQCLEQITPEMVIQAFRRLLTRICPSRQAPRV
ncbi:MAG: glycosyltransferase family 9 protein [Desulfobacterales bacterium]|nr:MAG: glycosyltransferase family 9 protein [Desulfobacterales bacterium]